MPFVIWTMNGALPITQCVETVMRPTALLLWRPEARFVTLDSHGCNSFLVLPFFWDDDVYFFTQLWVEWKSVVPTSTHTCVPDPARSFIHRRL